MRRKSGQIANLGEHADDFIRYLTQVIESKDLSESETTAVVEKSTRVK